MCSLTRAVKCVHRWEPLLHLDAGPAEERRYITVGDGWSLGRATTVYGQPLPGGVAANAVDRAPRAAAGCCAAAAGALAGGCSFAVGSALLLWQSNIRLCNPQGRHECSDVASSDRVLLGLSATDQCIKGQPSAADAASSGRRP